ncbi:MAG: EamA family transporter [Planctomycetes bacterium]|nr:EamA family transporter [Planctomycetota bacterium]
MNTPLPTATTPTASTAQLVIAFAIIYVVWGSTYLGMAIAIETMPPFLMAATRFIVAGTLLIAVRRALGDALPSAQHWRSAAIVGSLLFLGGNGAVAWAQHWVPSGIAALLITTTPFWMTMVPWVVGSSPRPAWTALVGIAIGLVGVALLVGAPVGATVTMPLVIGSLTIVMAALSWAIGSLCAKRLPLPSSPWMSSGAQMVCGALGLGLAGVVSGEATHLEVTTISLRSWLALAYLIFIGAIVGFSAYVYLLRHSTMTRVSTYAFVNPVVAVVLGWLVLGEPLSGHTLFAGMLIIVAVMLILRPGPPADQRSG